MATTANVTTDNCLKGRMLELYTHQNWTEETHYKLRNLMINGTERKGKRKTQPKIYQQNENSLSDPSCSPPERRRLRADLSFLNDF